MDTEFTHVPANASSADYQNHSSLVLIPPDQTTQYTTEKHTTDYNVEMIRSRPTEGRERIHTIIFTYFNKKKICKSNLQYSPF
eukprot:scaffold24027_cov86-Cyclotella_meneghiniana.AAC.1